MKDALRIGVLGCMLAAPVAAQSTAPVPRPSDDERSVLAEERAAITEALAGIEGPAIAEENRALTPEERAAFRAQVGQCWNVGSLDPEALSISVVIGFEMNREGRPIVESIELLEAESEDAELVEQMYQSARRAIVRCGANGYDLPTAAYARWQRMEINFVPNQALGQ